MEARMKSELDFYSDDYCEMIKMNEPRKNSWTDPEV